MPSSASSASDTSKHQKGRATKEINSLNNQEHINFQVTNIQELPIQYSERQCTDVFCLIVFFSFLFVMIVVSILTFDPEKYLKSNFPTDSDGKLCGVDYPAYPYVYFANPPQIGRRVCVSSCPKEGDKKLSCRMTSDVGCKFTSTPGFEVEYYDNIKKQNRIGMFCLPSDPVLIEQVLVAASLKNKFLFIDSMDAGFLSLAIGIGLSIIFFMLTQAIPEKMNNIVRVGAIGACLIIIILIFSMTAGALQIYVAIIFIAFLILLVFSYLKSKRNLKFQQILLKYSTEVISQNKVSSFLLILVFTLLLILAFAGLVWQFKRIWGGGHVIFQRDSSVFYEFKSGISKFLTIIWILEALWIFSFLKQSFNFFMSSYTVKHYFEEKKYNNYAFKTYWKHLGSIVAGSYMTGYWVFFDFFFDTIKPCIPDDESTTCGKFFAHRCVRNTIDFFDLVKPEAMPYINLTGNTYCNSARYCDYLYEQSLVLQYLDSASFSKSYRVSAHLLLAVGTAIISLLVNGHVSSFLALVIVFLMIFLGTFFISAHASAAQAIFMIFLTEEELEKRRCEQTMRDFSRNDFQSFKNINFWVQQKLKEEIEREIMQEIKRKQSLNTEQL